jgi:hypothetical protein
VIRPRRGEPNGEPKRVTLPSMTDTPTRRRGHGEDAIYFDAAKNRFVGAISVGFGSAGKRIRRKVTGRTKAEVRDKLKAAHAELDRGLHTSATYTVQHAVDDWLEGGLQGRSERTRSIYREALKPLLEHIGTRPLRELTARDVRRGLEALSERMSTRYLQLARASLARAIRYAEAHDLVGRNVATLVDNPKGQVGRPSRSFTLEQSLALLEAARESRLNAYVVMSLATGIRTEEARELHWDHVDLDGDPSAARPVPPSVAVWRSVRKAATPRRPSRGGRWRCPKPPYRLSETTGSGRPRTGSRPDPCGRTTAWSSPRPLARPWMRRTSDASSARSPRQLASVSDGRRGTCATPSSP